MINKKILNVLLVFSFFGLMMIISNSSAKADTWPQNGWGNDGNNVNASIDLFKNANHNSGKSYVAVNFRAYASGNTSSSNIAVNIVKDPDGAHTGCDLSGAATLWMYSYTNDGENKDVDWNSIQTFAGCPQFGSSKSITLSGGVYNAGLNKTVYNVGVAIVSASNGNRFRFDAQADGIEFGFGESGQLYFSIDGAGGNDAYKDIAIPVCVNADGEKSFSTYDPDNPDGTVQKNPYDFALKSNGVRKKAASTWASSGASGEWKYNNPENRRYSPRYGTGVTAGINYTMQKDKKYVFRMNNLGVNNYVSLKMPGREVCSGSVTKADWTIKSDSSVSPAVIYKGESTTFSHKAYNEGPLSTDKDVDVDMIRKWDGTGDWTGLNLYQPVAKDGSKSIADPQTFSTVGTYEEYVRYNPESDDDEDSNFTNGSTATAYVVAPTSGLEVPPGYEKGTGGTIDIKHKISISPCPPAGFTRTVSWKISGKEGNGVDYSETKDSTLGNGVCEDSVTKQLNGSWLDSNNVGPAVTYKTDAPTGFGSTTNTLSVYEVPFARFYGNDVYATNATTGNIRFNDSYNNDGSNFDGRGSLAQYAAFSTKGTILLDTAARRYSSVTGATLPPSGLSSNNMPTLPGLSADLQHSTAKSKLPPNNCTAIATASITPDTTGCYVKETGDLTVNGANYKSRTTIKGSNVIIGGQLNNTSFDPSPTDIGATFYQHIERNTRPTETSGYARGLTVGTYVLPAAVSATLPQMKDLSSVDVSPYYKVTMYDAFGNSIVLTDDELNFLNLPRPGGDWNDAVTKIVVEKLDPASYNTEATGVLLIIADNIYIDKSVQRLDAILVAKENIYTCANSKTPVSNSQLVSDCRWTLTVNGSLSAPNISFQRSVGSRLLNKGSSDLTNGSEICLGWQGVRNCGLRWYGTANANAASQAEINASGGTAEIINFPAYLYWAKPYLIDESSVGGTYKAIYTAPPRK